MRFTAAVLVAAILAGAVAADTIYVDVSNTGYEDGSEAHPWNTIQEGINSAVPGDTVQVAAGFYQQYVRMHDGVDVIGAGSDLTTIQCLDSHPWAVLFDGAEAMLCGFSIRGQGGVGLGENAPVVKDCDISVSASALGFAESALVENCELHHCNDGFYAPGGATVRNCIIHHNSRYGLDGVGGGYPGGQILNNVIHDNGHSGINLGSGPARVANNIIYHNGYTHPDGPLDGGGIRHPFHGQFTPDLGYNDVWNNTHNYSYCSAGPGDISADPRFVNGPLGNYYLSQTSAGQGVNSPCVNSGDPSVMAYGTTRTDGLPDTGRVDMGYHYPLEPVENWAWSLIGYRKDDGSPCLLADCTVEATEGTLTWEEGVLESWVAPYLCFYIQDQGYRLLATAGGDDDSFRSGLGYWILKRRDAELVFPTP